MSTGEEHAALNCVQEALAASKKAVALDVPAADESAVACAYREALAKIASATRSVKAAADSEAVETDLAQLRSIADAYEERAAVLEQKTTLSVAPRTAIAQGGDSTQLSNSRSAPQPDLYSPHNALALQSELEPTPTGKLSHACWRLRAVRRTLNGGWLTEGLFAPPGLYSQTGARVAGLSLKAECYAAAAAHLRAFCDATHHQPPSLSSGASTGMGGAEALVLLETLNRELAVLHERLYRAFPNLVASKPAAYAEKVPLPPTARDDSLTSHQAGASPLPPAPLVPPQPPSSSSSSSAKSSSTVVGGWSSWGASVAGRAAGALRVSAASLATVTSGAAVVASQQAMSAYARAKHAAVAEHLSGENAAKLTSAVGAVCVRAQIFDLWHASLDPLAKIDSGVAASLWQALDETAVFLEDCLGELMLRDTESLLEQHCAQASRSFVTLEWGIDQHGNEKALPQRNTGELSGHYENSSGVHASLHMGAGNGPISLQVI